MSSDVIDDLSGWIVLCVAVASWCVFLIPTITVFVTVLLSIFREIRWWLNLGNRIRALICQLWNQSYDLPIWQITSAPSTAQSQSSCLPIKLVNVWEFQEEGDYWLQFVEDQRLQLEDAYGRRDSELRFSPRNGQKRHRWARVVSFADMTQRNEASGKVRKIRRRVLKLVDTEETDRFPPEALLPLPTLAHTGSLERCPISTSEPEFDTIVKIFQDSMAEHRKSYSSAEWCPKPMVEVVKIDQVINPIRQRLYEAAQEEVRSRNPSGCGPVPGIRATRHHHPIGKPDLNEYFLFHGTKYDQVNQIIEYGLDPQRGGDSMGHMFGSGTYFAENASKSDMYTTCDQCATAQSSPEKCQHATGMRCVILAQVLLGKTCPVTNGDSKRIRAQDREDGKGPYDSHTALKKTDGGCVDHMEFIIFKEQRALVRFVIFYKHKEECKCKDCLFRRT